MALRDLLAKIKISSNPEVIDKLNDALDKFKNKTKETGEQGSASMENLARSLEGIKTRIDAVIGFELLKHLAELGERFAKMGEELKVTAESLGIGVEQFQKLGFAAQMSSVSQEQLSHSLVRLSRSLFEAKTGSTEAQETFARLGVPPGEISHLKTADQALMMLATRLQTMKEPMDKLALVTKTLGRGSMEMVTFLSQGPGAIQAKMREAARDGLILTDAQVNGLERMNHAIEKFEAKIKVILSTFIEPMSKITEKMVDAFVKIYNTNKAWVELNIEAFMLKIVWWLGFVFGFLETLIPRIRRVFGETGIFGKMLGDVALLGTAATALAAMATSLKIISSIAESAGIYKLFKIFGGLAIPAIGSLLGLGGGAAVGVASTGGITAGAGLAGGGIIASIVAAAPIVLAALAAGGIGYGAYRYLQKDDQSSIPGSIIGGGNAVDNSTTQHIDGRQTNTFNIVAPDAKDVAEQVQKIFNGTLLGAMSQLKGNKVGSQAIGSNNQ